MKRKCLVMLGFMFLFVSCSQESVELPIQESTHEPTNTYLPPTDIPEVTPTAIPIWDYVALGDSYPAGFGVEKSYVDYYAEFIEQDLGVHVEVQNFARSSQTVTILLHYLINDQELRAAIIDAEVITIYTGFNDLSIPLEKYRREICGGDDNLDCIREEVIKINSDFDNIFAEIQKLTGPQDALIRIANYHIPVVGSWQYKGWFDILLRPAYDDWRNHLNQISEDYGFTIIDTYHALNGPAGNQPFDDSIVLSGDRTHINEEGQKIIAQLHRDAGYEFGNIYDIEYVERVDVAFNGQNCIYDGSIVITEGEVVVALDNLSEYPAQLLVYAHEDGNSWQGVLDYYGEPGTSGGWPEFFIDVRSIVNIDEPQARKFTFEPRFHSILAMVTLEGRAVIFPCTPLDVRPAKE